MFFFVNIITELMFDVNREILVIEICIVISAQVKLITHSGSKYARINKAGPISVITARTIKRKGLEAK